MKVLSHPSPTPEQDEVIYDVRAGFSLISGAAGSGKTTSALLRLETLVEFWRDRRLNLGIDDPVRVLVLTYNRTLAGYVKELADESIDRGDDVELEVFTFGKWAHGLRGESWIDRRDADAAVLHLARSAGNLWHRDFLLSEFQYLNGLYLPEERDQYVDARRVGRGRSPQVGARTRRRLLDEVVAPYEAWKQTQKQTMDFNDVAIDLARNPLGPRYEIVVVDEAQDFSANQIRAIVAHLADDSSCTFIRDTTQRIYSDFFTWDQCGVDLPPSRSRRLKINYRNTKQIAAFARPLVADIEHVADGELPDFSACVREGERRPQVIAGTEYEQIDWIVDYLNSDAVGEDESVAILHPKAGGWLRPLMNRLELEGFAFEDVTRVDEWPQGDEQIVFSTMSSAKGLEFHHVLIPVFAASAVTHGDDDGDSRLEQQRRLLAMAIGRARESVVLGYDPATRPPILDFLDLRTHDLVTL